MPYNSPCDLCSYGNAETDNNDDGEGTMEAVYFGNNPTWNRGQGAGPWVMADLENGLYMGNQSLPPAPPCATTQCRNNDGSCPAGTHGIGCSAPCPQQCGGGACGCTDAPPSPPAPPPINPQNPSVTFKYATAMLKVVLRTEPYT